MLHHNPHYIAATEAERRTRASKRRLPSDPGELDALLLAAASGDDRGWTALVERFTARVRRAARLRQLSPHDVEDVVQATWLALLEHIATVRDPDALGAWLETTAHRESNGETLAGPRDIVVPVAPIYVHPAEIPDTNGWIPGYHGLLTHSVVATLQSNELVSPSERIDVEWNTFPGLRSRAGLSARAI